MSQMTKDMLGGEETAENGRDPETLRGATWGDIALYIFGGFGIYFLASFILGLFITEFNLALTFAISVINFLCLGGTLYLFGILRKKVSWSSMGLFPPKKILKQALLGVGFALAIIPLRFLAGAAAILLEFLIYGEVSSMAYRNDLLTTGLDSLGGVLIMVVGVGVLAPIAEELFFRGLLYDWFRQKFGVEWGIGISSLVFGLAHYDSLAVVLSSLIMGAAMAFAYEKTRSLWISIFMHVSTNTGAVLLLALIAQLDKIYPGLQY